MVTPGAMTGPPATKWGASSKMPRKPANLDGQRFGMLTVECLTDQRNSYGRLLYRCRCDCGGERLTTAANLKRGKVVSCGCKNYGPRKILTGQRFGKLIAICPTDEKIGTTFGWLCRCDCGMDTIVSENNLITGTAKSCGCLKSEKIQKLYRDKTAPCKLNESENPRKSNTSGVTGVYYDKHRELWAAEIMFRGKKRFIGRFQTKEEAAEARKEAEEEIFGKYLQSITNEIPEEVPAEIPQNISRLRTDLSQYIGNRYGGLIALSVEEERSPAIKSRFQCKCVHCGKSVTRLLLTLRKEPASCGCLPRMHRKKLGTEERICPICGNHFVTAISMNHKFCSSDCRNIENARRAERRSKAWHIQDPNGNMYHFNNLVRWARENVALYDPDSVDLQRSIRRFAVGISTVKRTVAHPDKKWNTRSSNYKGWKVVLSQEEIIREPQAKEDTIDSAPEKPDYARFCLACGKEIAGAPNKKYCEDCRKAHVRAYNTAYQRKKRAQKKLNQAEGENHGN